jgi:hypothetical protein
MKKGFLLYSVIVISGMMFFGFKNSDTVTKCVKIKCGNKGYYELMTGTDEQDIANQLKVKYNTCTYQYVDKKKCKSQ